MRVRLLLLAATLVTLLDPSPGWGQRTVPTHPASIRGQIRLSDGPPAPLGIPVYLEKRESGTAGQTQTDRQGKFEFEGVEPAIYVVRVHAQGYLDIVSDELNVVQMPMAYVNLTLRPDPRYKNPFVTTAPGGVISAESLNAPEGARKNLASGEELLQKGSDLPKSIEFFKKAVKAYPKYSEAYLMMGLAYRAQNNYDEAAGALRKCIEINANSAAAYTVLGEIQNQKQDYAGAEKTLLKAVALNSDSSQAQEELARTYWALGRWQEADPHAAKALTLAPNSPSAHLIMGNIQLRKRDGQAALQQFQEYLKLDPQGAMAPSVRDLVGKLEKALGPAQAR